MIPLKIDIKNFLSYGPDIQTVNFEPYHLICLNGKNGHGKSALLDAITWAIWGQARKTTGTNKADEGLVHLGQKHMLIVLDFIVGNNEYKVRREFIKTQSKGMCILEFGVKQEDGTIKSLTDKTIKATQDIIEKSIGITFDAFVNSTFLRQGQSNEFSKKSPKERKEILASILQLNDFDTLKNYALNAAREIQNTIASKENIIAHIGKEETELQTGIQSYPSVLEAIAQKKNVLLAQETEQKKITEEIKKIEQIKELYKLLQTQQQELIEQKNQKTAQLKTVSEQWHILHKQTIQTRSLTDTQQQIQLLQKQLALQHKAQEQKLQLKEKYLSVKEQETALLKIIESEFVQEQQKYNTQLSILHEQIKQNTEQKIQKEQTLTHCSRTHIELVHKKEMLEKQRSELVKACSAYTQDQLTKQQQRLHEAQTEIKQIQTQSEQLVAKQKHLDHPESCCPLCEQQLSTSRKKFLIAQCTKEQEHAVHKQNELSHEIAQLQETIKMMHIALLQDETKKKELVHLEQNLALTQSLLEKQTHENTILEKEYKQVQHKAQELVQVLESVQKQIAMLPNLLEQKKQNNNALLAVQKDIEQIIAQGKALNYNAQEHKQLQDQYDALHKTIELIENHQTLLAQKEELYQQLTQLYQVIQNLQDEWHKKEIQKKEYATIDDTALRAQLKNSEAQIQALQKEIQTLLQEQSKQELYQEKIKKIEQEKKELQTSIETKQKEVFDYQEIAKALGKDGIQALLIEEAIPEIENEANDLLSKLTNNQTHIFIESLRDLKKGGHKETLDIKIADNFGLRPYEMFSGGEAFRIDFALRIAISKLLARRAGTNLQTLIIDEGFGSQDEEGLGLIMDCLTKIQDDFAKVIIISHLPLLKEQFPVQFFVHKQASGSVISVIEQG